MSEIYVSIYEIESFSSDVSSTANEVKRDGEETLSKASEMIDLANRALKHATDACNMMLEDEANAKKTLEHDKKMLDLFYRQLEAAEKAKSAAWKAQVAASNAYKAAKEEQTRVRNSSESTPEARKAAAQAVRDASAAYSEAKNHYNEMCRLVNELKGKIEHCKGAITRLEYMINQIGYQIQQAKDYIYRVQRDAEALVSESKSFRNVANSTISTLNSCQSSAASAARSLSSAVDAIARTGGSSASSYHREPVRMGNGAATLTPMIQKMAENFERNERAIEEQRRRARRYGSEIMDEISEQAVYTILEICDALRRANLLLEEIRVELRKAQNYLQEYSSYGD